MSHSRAVQRALIVVGAALGLGCGGGSSTPTGTKPPPPPPPGTPNSVVVTNNTFTPGTLNIQAGSSVTWTWDSCSGGDQYGYGQTCVAHDVVLDDGTADSGSLSSGTFAHRFSTAGTFTYHCAIHGTAMSGKVVVQ